MDANETNPKLMPLRKALDEGDNAEKVIEASGFQALEEAIAETEIDSAVASILNSLVPLNAILLGFAIFKIGFTKRQFLGVIIGFLGTCILILRGADLNPEQNYLYAGFVILSTIMYALNVNIIKKLG